jgi:hypothetical protein
LKISGKTRRRKVAMVPEIRRARHVGGGGTV